MTHRCILLLLLGYDFDFRLTTTTSIIRQQKRKYVMPFSCPAAIEVNEDFVIAAPVVVGVGMCNKYGDILSVVHVSRRESGLELLKLRGAKAKISRGGCRFGHIVVVHYGETVDELI